MKPSTYYTILLICFFSLLVIHQSLTKPYLTYRDGRLSPLGCCQSILHADILSCHQTSSHREERWRWDYSSVGAFSSLRSNAIRVFSLCRNLFLDQPGNWITLIEGTLDLRSQFPHSTLYN